jgi:N-acyl-D-amino-acid deacylase
LATVVALLASATGAVEPAGAPVEGDSTPEPVATGDTAPALASFDRLLLDFLAEHRVPGAALAVVKEGRLVLARGYGYADVERREPVTPRSLFRIASLSKPITAAAVLKLVEEGRFRLEDKVSDLLAGAPYAPRERCDARLAEVMVLELLQHTGGFDRERSFDPMFRSVRIARSLGRDPPAGPEDIIRYMWERPLDFAPGERHSYSNFGYCLLGRAIERASGMPYETYVKERILAPVGIRSMRLGKTLRRDRAPGEVSYYDDPGASGPAVVGEIGARVSGPYGAWYLEAMDAHGGWIASAVDLARFAAELDRPERCRILRADTVARMFSRPAGKAGYEEDGRPRDHYYGCGWAVRPVAVGGTPGGEGNGILGANTWHTGSLTGTSTLMVRRHDGVDWVVLFNARECADGKTRLAERIDPLLHRAADAVTAWPEVDLFEKYR